MVIIHPVLLDNYTIISIEVKLPKTNLLVLHTERGYVMCGALDIELLRRQLPEREIVAARAIGVKNIEELLNGVVDSCTQAAESLGIFPEMSIREALKMMKYSESPSPH